MALGSTGHPLRATKLAIIMVGLPASGKSFTSRNLSRYLRWLGIVTFTFSAAIYRQQLIGTHINADFFDTCHAEFLAQRTLVANATLNDMLLWFEGNEQDRVAIMDASNTTTPRRHIIKSQLEARGIAVIFLECIYEMEGLLHEHLPHLHLLSPDYAHMDAQQAQADYKQRIQHYRKDYEPLTDADGAHIKLINGGRQLVASNVTGLLPSRIIFYLMNLHCGAKTIFLQVVNAHRPSHLDQAIADCRVLAQDALDQSRSRDLQIWCCPEGASHICQSDAPVQVKSQIAGINMANLEGLSALEIATLYPDEALRHDAAPYKHRYPRCESYADLSRRLEMTMMELERLHDNVLIMADISTIRCIYAYYVETANVNVQHTQPIHSPTFHCRTFPHSSLLMTRWWNSVPWHMAVSRRVITASPPPAKPSSIPISTIRPQHAPRPACSLETDNKPLFSWHSQG